MTREEQINEAVKTSITETLMSAPNYEFSPSEIDVLECAFEKGAQWADQHPVNPWHDASKELPEMGGLYLVHNGRACQTIRYNKEQNRWGVNPWMLVSVKYWMPIPEIEKED